MKKEDLSQDKQRQFDAIISEMMEEINALPPKKEYVRWRKTTES
ncbi:MAG: hypothetical protein PUF77_02855 [Clostridiales bacterium]|nr:hypothetical protein [Clostridiales bacterium]